MCRAGGPRCDGKRKARNTTNTTTTSAGTATAVAEPTPIERSLANAAEVSRQSAAAQAAKTPAGVPTREHTDELASKLGANRTGWDGQPLDDKGRRLYALRESGYKGPIDQDGYPDTTSDGADTLRYMATQCGEKVNW